MKRYVALTTIVVLITIHCNSQKIDVAHHNALSIEIGKTGMIFDLTYDHKFKTNSFGFRVIGGSNLGRYLTLKTFGGGGYSLIGKKKFL